MRKWSNTNQPTAGMTTCFGLLRHGQTVWNAEKRVQGHGDSPLTASGRNQVAKWAEELRQRPWHHLLVSDLGRARETAEILNTTLQLPLTEENRLREQYWGEWEGLKVADIRQFMAAELERQIQAGWNFRPPGGESRQEVLQRVLTALTETHTHLPGCNILVICHMGVIKCLLYHLANRSFLPDEPPLIEDNRFHLIGCSDSRFRIDQLNIPQRDRT